MQRSFGVLIVASLLGLVACGQEPLAPRGVILVSLDTLRADRVGFQGYERATTPFLDRLAEKGLIFERAYSQAPWTLPAHATLLTSMYPSVLGLAAYPRAGIVPAEAVSLAEHLRAAGFRTHAETAGGFLSASLGFGQGFEHYEDRSRSFRQGVDRASAWLADLPEQERFFLFLHTYDIHRYEPPGWARRELVDANAPPQQLAHALAQVTARGSRGLAEFIQNPVFASQIRELAKPSKIYLDQLYDASVRAADAQIERLWKQLEELGLAEETLLIITSDHGEELFDHGRTGHGFTLYDENLRVPLLLVHASVGTGRIARVVPLLDLAPTVSAVLQLPPAPLWQGESLLVDGSSTASGRLVFAESAHWPMRAVRDGAFKLIRRPDGKQEFYDLRADPGESSNLSGSANAAADRLGLALDQWQRDVALHRLQVRDQPVQLAPALHEQLEALGYLDPVEAGRAR